MVYSMVYERDGTIIKVDDGDVTVKKNGLTITIPSWMVSDFVREFELGLDNEIQNLINGVKFYE